MVGYRIVGMSQIDYFEVEDCLDLDADEAVVAEIAVAPWQQR